MKLRLLSLTLLLSSVAHADLLVTGFSDSTKDVEIVQRDSMMPFRIEDRVYFYAHVTYKRELVGIPAGTEALVLWGVNCASLKTGGQAQEKTVVIELALPGQSSQKMHPHDEAIATEMREKAFRVPNSGLNEGLVAHICNGVTK